MHRLSGISVCCVWLHCIYPDFTKYQPTRVKPLCRLFFDRNETTFGGHWPSTNDVALLARRIVRDASYCHILKPSLSSVTPSITFPTLSARHQGVWRMWQTGCYWLGCVHQLSAGHAENNTAPGTTEKFCNHRTLMNLHTCNIFPQNGYRVEWHKPAFFQMDKRVKCKKTEPSYSAISTTSLHTMTK